MFLGSEIIIHLTFYRVRPGRLDQLKTLLAEMGERADEVREAFAHEGVAQEQAFLLETAGGHVIAAAVECEDYDAARQLFSESTFPIDVMQRKVVPEVTDGVMELAPLFDVRVPVGPGSMS
jgi:hypothetical protein